jgi:hypothetical protein
MGDSMTYAAILLGVLCFRYAMLVTFHFWSIAVDRGGLAPNPSGIDDGDYYWALAQALADGWDTDSANVFPVVLGWMMRVTDIREIFFYKHLNFIVGLAVIAAAVGLYRVFVPMAQRRSEMFLILFLGLYPSALVFEHVSLYRDGWIFLLHMLALLIFMRTKWQHPLWALAGLTGIAAALGALATFRWYAALATVLGAMLWLLWRRLGRLGVRHATGLISGGFLVALALVIPVVYSGAFGLFDSELLLRALDYRSGETGSSGSSIGISFRNVNSITVVPVFLYSVASNVWGPLPWQARSLNTLAAFLVESSVMLLLSFFILRWRRRSNPQIAFLTFQAAAWFAAIGFFNDNLGTGLRLRVLGWHVLLVLCAVLRDSAQEPMAHSLNRAAPPVGDRDSLREARVA